MVYICDACGQEWWRNDCETKYNGGSGFFICPDCGETVTKSIGEIETRILTTLPDDGSLSKTELANKTSTPEIEIANALKHLVDMSYLGTTPGWQYTLYSNGKDKKQELLSQN